MFLYTIYTSYRIFVICVFVCPYVLWLISVVLVVFIFSDKQTNNISLLSKSALLHALIQKQSRVSLILTNTVIPYTVNETSSDVNKHFVVASNKVKITN